KTIYNRLSYGIRVGQWDMRYDDFKNIKLYIPPREEQDQIVKYLDSKLSKVNKFIKAKKKQIELLKEQKQAIINQAVTKGLDPNVKMKPSGIEWIGDIPDGWEVVQLRRVTKTIKTGGTPQGADDKYYADNGFNWFTPSDFNESLYLKDSSRQLSELGKQSINLFPANTIMMIGIGATMGKVSISEGVCSCNQQINAIVCNVLVDERYLTYYLRAKKQYILDTAKYTTLPILNQDETKKIPILKCNINEQLKIVTYTEAKVEVIDKAIDILKKEIDLITEYRISLISDVVTGKVDVRNIEIQDVDKETEEGFEDTDDEIIDEENGEIGEGV
ncbi:MAG: restriction endonuclease subunit S, partial [Tepidanaerobacteraceae bacterium]|nr:restriction endonuclease subunit S [Tepidanaerobacteraceae bacterium]